MWKIRYFIHTGEVVPLEKLGAQVERTPGGGHFWQNSIVIVIILLSQAHCTSYIFMINCSLLWRRPSHTSMSTWSAWSQQSSRNTSRYGPPGPSSLAGTLAVQCTRHSTPSTVHQVHFTRYSTPGTVHQVQCTRYSTPGTVHQVQYTRYSTPGTVHQVQNTRYRTPGTVHQVQNTRYNTENWKMDSATPFYFFIQAKKSQILVHEACSDHKVLSS